MFLKKKLHSTRHLSLPTADNHFFAMTPFVCHIVPSVGNKDATVSPLVRHKQPFVCHIAKYYGFTLVELMTTIVVLGILIAVGVPNFMSFVQKNRLVTATNDIVLDLTYARSEAIKQRLQVGLCPSNSAFTECDASGNWTSGWIVFLDADNSLSWSSGDTVLKIHQALPTDLSLTAITGSTSSGSTVSVVALTPTARTANNEASSFRICSKKLSKQRRVFLDGSGRTKLTEETC